MDTSSLMVRPLNEKALQQMKTSAIDFTDSDIILHLGGQRGGEETASSSLCPPPLPIFSSIHDVFTAILLSLSWALPCSSSSLICLPQARAERASAIVKARPYAPPASLLACSSSMQ